MMFISTETGIPFKYVGSYFHNETAFSAAWYSSTGPEMIRLAH